MGGLDIDDRAADAGRGDDQRRFLAAGEGEGDDRRRGRGCGTWRSCAGGASAGPQRVVVGCSGNYAEYVIFRVDGSNGGGDAEEEEGGDIGKHAY